MNYNCFDAMIKGMPIAEQVRLRADWDKGEIVPGAKEFVAAYNKRMWILEDKLLCGEIH